MPTKEGNHGKLLERSKTLILVYVVVGKKFKLLEDFYVYLQIEKIFFFK